MGLTFELVKVLEDKKITSPNTAIPAHETETWEIHDDVMSYLVDLCFKYTTVEGVFHKITDSTKELEVRRKLLSAHPHLDVFMGHPEAEVFQINIKSFLLLNGLTRASFEEIPESDS